MIFISILINYSKDMFFPLKKENNSALFISKTDYYNSFTNRYA